MSVMWLHPAPFVSAPRRQLGSSPSSSQREAPTSPPPTSSPVKLDYEANTMFGKLTLTNLQPGKFLAPARQIQYSVDWAKQRLGITKFGDEDADALVQSGILHGPQWKHSPPKDKALQRYPAHYYETRGVAGSLTFSPPGLRPYAILQFSTALRALSALVAIGVAGSPRATVEHIVSSIVDGVVVGLIGDEDYPDTVAFKRLLSAILLEIEKACGRSGLHRNSFSEIVAPLIEELPLAIKRRCPKTMDEVVVLTIQPSQLQTIAEWAFTEQGMWTLVLGDSVEILASSIVCLCMGHDQIRQVAIDCSEKKIEWESGHKSSLRGLAIFGGGTAQDAMKLLQEKGWMNLRIPNPPREIPNLIPECPLYCDPTKVIGVCRGYLMSTNMNENETAGLLESLTRDSVALFSRKVVVNMKEEHGYTNFKEDNVSFHYEFLDEFRTDLHWKEWFDDGLNNIESLVARQPAEHLQFGSQDYYGYAAKFLRGSRYVGLHAQQMDDLRKKNVRSGSGDSTISNVVAEVAGLIYSLALSRVMADSGSDMAIRGALGGGFRLIFSELNLRPRELRVIARRVVLGALGSLWLGVPHSWAPEYPHVALALGNSRGNVVSAVLADSPSLEYATTKFVVTTAVADILDAEQPVVLCAGWKPGRVTGSHTLSGDCRESEPRDGCQELVCLTMALEHGPTLSSRLDGNCKSIGIVGYISCGTEWYTYVDLDLAFMVAAVSAQQKVCPSTCPINPPVNWLKEREFLRRASNGYFSLALPEEGMKLFIPANGSGLKQSFLASLFYEWDKHTRSQGEACLAHAEGSVVID